MVRTTHVVVGSGLPGYFLNCLTSIFRNCTAEVVAVYNFISEKDRNRASEALSNLDSNDQLLKVFFLPNGSESKTGALYTAYNLALQYVPTKSDLVSFVQSDMQMLWWSEAIAEEALKILTPVAGEPRVACVSSQVPSFGKDPSFYQTRMKQGDSRGVRFDSDSNAVSDVGIYSHKWLKESGFSFQGSEHELSRNLWIAGYRLGHATPFLGAIPFPSVVRYGGRRRVGLMGVRVTPLVLTPAHNAEAIDRKSEIWLEDLVAPARGFLFFPYWPSDLRDGVWLRKRRLACKMMGLGLFSMINKEGRVFNLYWPLALSPHMLVLLADAGLFYIRQKLRGSLKNFRRPTIPS